MPADRPQGVLEMAHISLLAAFLLSGLSIIIALMILIVLDPRLILSILKDLIMEVH